MCAVERAVDSWLDEHQPDAVAVERVFSQHNVRTVMGTAQASGIALVAAARRGIPVALHTPSEVKAAVSGSGRADKAQVGAMVARLLRLDAAAPARGRRGRAGSGHLPHLARCCPGQDRGRTAGGGRDDEEPTMIAFVRGTVADVTLSSVVIEVGGVGLELHCTPPTLATLHVGATTTLPTSMIVREESLTLFGFLDDDEKSVFELLQTASGVGAEAGPGDAGGPDPRRAAPGDHR